MNANNLTRKQQNVLNFLREQGSDFDHPPTLDELCQALGLKSRGSLHKHIQALVDAGYLEPMDHKRRGIRLIDAQPTEDSLPFLGYIAAGQPIEALENPEAIEVPEHLRSSKSCFVLRVKGDSMIDTGILDGDWVVIEKRSHARDGEIVVALIEESEATLKRIEQTREYTILHPANASMESMKYRPEQVRIQGVLVGQMRTY